MGTTRDHTVGKSTDVQGPRCFAFHQTKRGPNTSHFGYSFKKEIDKKEWRKGKKISEGNRTTKGIDTLLFRSNIKVKSDALSVIDARATSPTSTNETYYENVPVVLAFFCDEERVYVADVVWPMLQGVCLDTRREKNEKLLSMRYTCVSIRRASQWQDYEERTTRFLTFRLRTMYSYQQPCSKDERERRSKILPILSQSNSESIERTPDRQTASIISMLTAILHLYIYIVDIYI